MSVLTGCAVLRFACVRACLPACMRAAVVVWLWCACAVVVVLLCRGGAVLLLWFWCGCAVPVFLGAFKLQSRIPPGHASKPTFEFQIQPEPPMSLTISFVAHQG
eukprot:9005768-Alexandrium_andersonii.AAC.1